MSHESKTITLLFAGRSNLSAVDEFGCRESSTSRDTQSEVFACNWHRRYGNVDDATCQWSSFVFCGIMRDTVLEG